MSFSCFGAFGSCKQKPAAQAGEIAATNVRHFSYNSLRSATRDFHPSNRIGGGGYGVVYRGVLRDGTHAAIKCLSAESKQGGKEFLTEINMISKIQHPNLVELIGCCVEGSHLILVYEYLENNSLAGILLGSKGKHIALDWPKRAAICIGTASGLAFLHEEAEPHIVHRDIKASNILLDGNFHPKIGDFGLARLFPDNVTHITTRVAGTAGYLAPEYARLGQLTKKADVYSFGVLLLEIISGRSSSKVAFGEDLLVLVEWAWKLRDEGRILDIVDPELVEFPEEKVLQFIKVALFCTQAASHRRPGMKQVVDMLSKEVTLNEKLLTEPGVYKARTSKSLAGGSSQVTSSFMKKGKQSIDSTLTSGLMDSSESVTQIIPRLHLRLSWVIWFSLAAAAAAAASSPNVKIQSPTMCLAPLQSLTLPMEQSLLKVIN
ncbi:putative serine/threonine-protein kinase isoform X1 [Diospyros lotus]|uniref:putative serine/threonine-protein kinase isoform X1 n=2 Tax=Diospyros lotus TaxID=55363 RepID=UPI002254DC9B|nr:putative serine/threonine-protein kinase isoform X1 [Diospyros lotus]